MNKTFFNIGILLILLSSNSCSQSKDTFQTFSAKFKECNLPVKGEELENGVSISQEEFNLFAVGSDLWLFKEDFHYNSSVKFNLENGIYALIYIRSYYPDNIENEKMEVVLATYSKEGKIINSLPIHGIHGDESQFYGLIDENYMIKIDSQKYIVDTNSGESVIVEDQIKYQIAIETGEIRIIE